MNTKTLSASVFVLFTAGMICGCAPSGPEVNSSDFEFESSEQRKEELRKQEEERKQKQIEEAKKEREKLNKELGDLD